MYLSEYQQLSEVVKSELAQDLSRLGLLEQDKLDFALHNINAALLAMAVKLVEANVIRPGKKPTAEELQAAGKLREIERQQPLQNAIVAQNQQAGTLVANPNAIAKFREVYKASLIDCMVAQPDRYSYSIDNVAKIESVSHGMASGLANGSANMDGMAVKECCKRLGIAHNRKALATFFSTEL